MLLFISRGEKRAQTFQSRIACVDLLCIHSVAVNLCNFSTLVVTLCVTTLGPRIVFE